MSELVKVSGAIIEGNNGEILIVQEPGNDQWSLPGGTAKQSESSMETLLRGLGEKFIELQICEIPESLRQFEPSKDNPRKITIFLVKIEGVARPNPEKIAGALLVDQIAEDYDLSFETISSIYSLRRERLTGKNHPRPPPKILDGD